MRAFGNQWSLQFPLSTSLFCIIKEKAIPSKLEILNWNIKILFLLIAIVSKIFYRDAGKF